MTKSTKDKVSQTTLLGAVARSCNYLDPETKGGAHTDVMVVDPERLTEELSAVAGISADEPFVEKLSAMSDALAERFIVKRGKIEDFAMKVVGPRENVIPRDLMSSAFGPHGYNLLPTVEKVVTGCAEAAREVPYFAFGDRSEILAPDVLGQLQKGLANRRKPRGFLKPKTDLFLSFLDEAGDNNIEQSVYDVLTDDGYFKGTAGSFEELVDYQKFVRHNPLTREMEDSLSTFFDAPITVGVRDAVRWAMGSRHPEMGWETARATILASFDSRGTENFLPSEVTYYAVDVDKDPAQMAGLVEVNERVVQLFAPLLDDSLKQHGFIGVDGPTLKEMSRQILDFHHGYPIYELEPYQGLLSVSSLKMLVRVGVSLARLAVSAGASERRNVKLDHLARRPGQFVRFAASLEEDERNRLFEALEQTLAAYVARGGVRDESSNIWQYHRIPRTFYSFQDKAQYPASLRGRVEDTFTLEKLHTAPYNELLRTLPELAEKLTVFFTLVYRYYKDTGFVPDLRPQNAGRDIFLLGIWGYVSDNLLIILWRDKNDELHADLSFVDNKDQFKEYRRGEDRRQPVGQAKHAMRLTGSLVEPAMLRSIGLFTEATHNNRSGAPAPRPSLIEKYASQGLDIAQEVIHSAVENIFDNTKVAVEDLVDDTFTGIKKLLGPKD